MVLVFGHKAHHAFADHAAVAEDVGVDIARAYRAQLFHVRRAEVAKRFAAQKVHVKFNVFFQLGQRQFVFQRHRLGHRCQGEQLWALGKEFTALVGLHGEDGFFLWLVGRLQAHGERRGLVQRRHGLDAKRPFFKLLLVNHQAFLL